MSRSSQAADGWRAGARSGTSPDLAYATARGQIDGQTSASKLKWFFGPDGSDDHESLPRVEVDGTSYVLHVVAADAVPEHGATKPAWLLASGDTGKARKDFLKTLVEVIRPIVLAEVEKGSRHLAKLLEVSVDLEDDSSSLPTTSSDEDDDIPPRRRTKAKRTKKAQKPTSPYKGPFLTAVDQLVQEHLGGAMAMDKDYLRMAADATSPPEEEFLDCVEAADPVGPFKPLFALTDAVRRSLSFATATAAIEKLGQRYGFFTSTSSQFRWEFWAIKWRSHSKTHSVLPQHADGYRAELPSVPTFQNHLAALPAWIKWAQGLVNHMMADENDWGVVFHTAWTRTYAKYKDHEAPAAGSLRELAQNDDLDEADKFVIWWFRTCQLVMLGGIEPESELLARQINPYVEAIYTRPDFKLNASSGNDRSRYAAAVQALLTHRLRIRFFKAATELALTQEASLLMANHIRTTKEGDRLREKNPVFWESCGHDFASSVLVWHLYLHYVSTLKRAGKLPKKSGDEPIMRPKTKYLVTVLGECAGKAGKGGEFHAVGGTTPEGAPDDSEGAAAESDSEEDLRGLPPVEEDGDDAVRADFNVVASPDALDLWKKASKFTRWKAATWDGQPLVNISVVRGDDGSLVPIAKDNRGNVLERGPVKAQCGPCLVGACALGDDCGFSHYNFGPEKNQALAREFVCLPVDRLKEIGNDYVKATKATKSTGFRGPATKVTPEIPRGLRIVHNIGRDWQEKALERGAITEAEKNILWPMQYIRKEDATKQGFR